MTLGINKISFRDNGRPVMATNKVADFMERIESIWQPGKTGTFFNELF
jgi:hypothetical protein